MSWTARQRAMLGEMGLRVWLPPATAPTTEPAAMHRAGVDAPPVAAAPAAAAGSAATSVARPPPTPTASVGERASSMAEPISAAPGSTAGESSAPGAAAGEASARGTTAAASLFPDHPPPAVAARAAAVPAAPPDERARRIATLDWTPLRESVAGCTACRLCETRTHTVFGNGHPQAQWLVVGEAPGEQEDRTGEPFVGPAGQLLDRMLAALQLTRAAAGDDGAGADIPTSRRVFVANTLKCRPPRNRNPMPDELALCEPYLQRQVALLRPRMILAMGAYALKLLLGSDAPVGKLRGQVHRYQGVPLVATYHPAYLLRQPAEKAKSWADLCLAADHFVPREGDDVPVA